ncbi:uncharacterized protein LOC133194959 [Saccostrea echinata]|uniref:uncharacterized protein LOC133194959 n=1 Tax=Saccostrea echinata TaxID=191078 RepID=UPI002A828310|nr:uncharacterized protein LOC133194959 [Saccostrea echinata]
METPGKNRGKNGKFISNQMFRKANVLEENRQRNKEVDKDDASVSLSQQEFSEANDVDGVLGLHVPYYLNEHDYAQKEDEVDTEILLKDDDSTKSDKQIEWFTGRRVIELGYVVNKLIEGCNFCGHPLKLTDICGEVRYGLGSLLRINCKMCNKVTSVPSGKRHSRVDDHASRAFDENTKLALGMLHSGIGEKKVSMLLRVLNIPPLSHTALKSTEREAGKAVEDVARQSCDSVVTAERESSSNNEELMVSFDGGWQKRGSGRSFSSLSGHAAMIGRETGRIVHFATHNGYCKICHSAEKTGKTPSTHDCRKNWTGSSKAMEPDMCIEMLKDLGEKDVQVGTIIMDNDTTTIARARTEVNSALKKQSDKNHTLKQFTNKLYDLKKCKNYKELNPKTISHLSKCFRYCVSQNQHDLDGMRKNMEAISRHVFGDHSLCGSWCGYLSSPTTYKPVQLPYHRYLSNEELKVDLTSIIDFYISQADRLVDLGSTQPNESFNNTVASKTPKSTFYSGSESNDFRVNEKLFLSPGKVTSKIAMKTDLKRKKDKDKEDTAEYKKRRALKKAESKKNHESSAVKEGITYETDVDINNNIDNSITEIPPPLIKPISTPIAAEQYTFVYFDLETTGLEKDCEVTQIAACTDDKIFSQYVTPPTKPISASATAVTGLVIRDNIMYKNGHQVLSKTTEEAFQSFIDWMKQFTNIILVAHNAIFDSRIIVRLFDSVELCASDFFIGFTDTLPLCRELIPNRKSYKLTDLAKDICSRHYDAHDALSDAQTLQELVLCVKASSDMMLKHSFTTQFLFENNSFADLTSRNLCSLQHLVDSNVLSKFTANKVASSGLHFQHLCLAYQRDAVNGIKYVLSDKHATGM